MLLVRTGLRRWRQSRGVLRTFVGISPRWGEDTKVLKLSGSLDQNGWDI